MRPEEATVHRPDSQASAHRGRSRAVLPALAGIALVGGLALSTTLPAWAEQLDAAPASVTDATLTSTLPTVYPVKDGFRDTVSFTLASTTSTSETEPATGSIKIVNAAGRLVKSWTLADSSTRKVTWDGLHGGNIVGGTYTVTASIASGGSPALTKSLVVKVSSKKLVAKTVTQAWRNGDTVITDFTPQDRDLKSWCHAYGHGSVDCVGLDLASGSPADAPSVVAHGKVGVPTVVRDNAHLGPASVRVTMKAWVDGHLQGVVPWVSWGYSTESSDGPWDDLTGQPGTATLGWHPLTVGDAAVYVDAALPPYESIAFQQFRVEYRYTALE
jgi:hypothetical protein